MKIRLLFAALCMLILPMWFSPASGVEHNPAPYATVAIAGHTLGGGWCECGCPSCLCDPGEDPAFVCGGIANPVDASSDMRPIRVRPSRGSELDFGSGAIFIALALFVWSRMRA